MNMVRLFNVLERKCPRRYVLFLIVQKHKIPWGQYMMERYGPHEKWDEHVAIPVMEPSGRFNMFYSYRWTMHKRKLRKSWG